jgi:phosphoglycerate kinase
MSRKRSVRQLGLKPGTAVLVRVDYNVPFDLGTQKISDDSRIAASVETIEYLKSRSCRVILCSHLGRPLGQSSAALSLAPVVTRLSELLGERVRFSGGMT